MIRIIKADGTAEREQIASMRSRAAEVGADIERAVGAVMQDVREKGFSAVEKYSLQFDRKAPYEIGMETLEEASALLAKIGKAGDTVLFENDLPDNY
mgnify:CR=1 FL=1